MDVTYGTEVTVRADEPAEPPDYIIKCWRRKRLLGVKETQADRVHEQTEGDGLAEIDPNHRKPMSGAAESMAEQPGPSIHIL